MVTSVNLVVTVSSSNLVVVASYSSQYMSQVHQATKFSQLLLAYLSVY